MKPSCAESLLRVGCIACVSVCLRRRVFAPMPSAWEKPKPKHWGEKPLSDHQIEAKKSQDQPPVCDLFIRKTSANWGLRKSLSDSRKKLASKFAVMFIEKKSKKVSQNHTHTHTHTLSLVVLGSLVVGEGCIVVLPTHIANAHAHTHTAWQLKTWKTWKTWSKLLKQGHG
jgi:hypothetical protein